MKFISFTSLLNEHNLNKTTSLSLEATTCIFFFQKPICEKNDKYLFQVGENIMCKNKYSIMLGNVKIV